MRKPVSCFLYLGYSVLLMSSSCNTDCNDCGPVSRLEVTMKNQTQATINLSFYQSGSVIDSINIKPNESATLQKWITGSPPEGELSALPYGDVAYDSVKYWLNTGNVIYKRTECAFHNNPLCESNYVTVKDTQDKKGNKLVVKSISIHDLE